MSTPRGHAGMYETAHTTNPATTEAYAIAIASSRLKSESAPLPVAWNAERMLE